MALVKCKECGTEISTKATSCPKCGAPNTAQSKIVTIGGGFIVLILVASIIGKLIENNNKANDSQENVPVLEVSPDELTESYDQNTVAADSRFKGRSLSMTAVVESINTDIMGDAYLTIRGGSNEFNYPHATLRTSEKQNASALRKGQQIRLLCVGDGDMAKTPMLKDCIVG